MQAVAKDRAYLEARSIPVPFAGCWLWLGAAGPYGHGMYGADGRVNRYAHRLAYTLYRGEIPAGMCVLHNCDSGWCVNPDHLRLGTRQDNNEDRRIRGRAAKKLTRDQAEEIRLSVESGAGLARRFGVSQSMVSVIRSGKYWRCWS